METQEKMLRELLALTKENRDMIKAINSQRRLSNVFYFIKWLIVIVILYSAYQAAVPFVNSAQSTLNQISNITTDPLSNIQNKVFNQVQQKLKNVNQ